MVGEEPDPERVPPEKAELLEDMQLALLICDYLSDTFDNFSGRYTGKDLTILPMLFELYNVEGKEYKLIMLGFIRTIEQEYIKFYSNKAAQAKAREESTNGRNKSNNSI